MTITRRSRRVVVGLMRRLGDDYGGFKVIGKTWTHEPTSYRRLVEHFESGAVGGAGVWLTNEAGEVLLVRNEGEDGWTDPGGKIEPGETVAETARREVREETDVACRLTGIHELHVVRNMDVERNRPPLFEPIVIFDGEYAVGEPRPREGEIAEVGWFAGPPDTVRYEEVRMRPYPGEK